MTTRSGSEPEIDLLLERIHLGNLHLKPVSEPDDAPRAPANQMVALRIKNVEVIRHCGKRHQPAHRQAGNIDEETEVASVSDQRRVALRISGRELLL